MNRESARAEIHTNHNVERKAGAAALSRGDLALTARLSREGLDRQPDDPDLMRLLLVAQLALHEIEDAQATATRLEVSPLSTESLDAIVSARLAADHVASARDIVARAVSEGGVPHWSLEAARARIAMHQNDLAAARAILVRGIERTPDAPTLRTLMLEVLMADGDASHAREVTARLGRPPSAPPPMVLPTGPDDAANIA
jgi:thioredoxin-like negative regulator of GroEL